MFALLFGKLTAKEDALNNFNFFAREAYSQAERKKQVHPRT
jgi:hypothetical protein